MVSSHIHLWLINIFDDVQRCLYICLFKHSVTLFICTSYQSVDREPLAHNAISFPIACSINFVYVLTYWTCQIQKERGRNLMFVRSWVVTHHAIATRLWLISHELIHLKIQNHFFHISRRVFLYYFFFSAEKSWIKYSTYWHVIYISCWLIDRFTIRIFW